MSLLAAAAGGASTPAANPTPFEASNYATFTTLAEELTYLQGLASAYPTKVAYQSAGTTLGGRPIPMVVLGSGAGTPIYGRASIHGNEPVPREVALALAYRIATSTDPAVVSFLAEHKFYLMTTASPDATAAGTRETAGVNLNRDGVNVNSVEVAATFAQIVARRPLAYIDMHEAITTGGTPLQATFGIHRLGSASMASFSLNVMNRSIKAAANAAGYSMGWYPTSPNPEIAQQAVQMHGVPATLTETDAQYEAPQLRFELGMIAVWAWFLDICKNVAEYQAVYDAAALELSTRTSWSVNGGYPTGTWPGSTGTVVEAAGYEMTPAQYASAQSALEAHGVVASESGGLYTVLLDSPESAWAVALLDPASSVRKTTATRIPPPTP